MIKIKINNILREGKEMAIDENHLASKYFLKNDYFANTVTRDYIQHLFIPLLKECYSPAGIKRMFDYAKQPNKFFMVEDYAYNNLDRGKFNYFINDWLSKKSNPPIVDHIRSGIISCLPIAVSYMTHKSFDGFRDDTSGDKRTFAERLIDYTFTYFYDVIGKEPPTIPVLQKYPKTENKAMEENIDFLMGNEKMSKEDVKKLVNKIELLKTNKITGNIGQGAYGRIYALDNSNWVLKIFSAGADDVQKDLNRIEKGVDAVYGRSASIEDMHYFDIVKISTRMGDVYCAVMPKIIPYRSIPEYNSDPKIRKFFMEMQQFARWANSENNFYSDIDDFKDDFMFNWNDSLPARAEDYFKAAYRAYEQHEGTDLHGGNIGFLAQRPDVLFYFDM